MAYPASLDELTDGVPADGSAATTALGDATYQHDDHHRDLATAVEAIEAELGIDPAGASATVVARLDAADTTAAAKVAKSTLTAKGSLISASAASTPVEVPVGADGYVPVADSSQAVGWKWAAASSIADMGSLGNATRYGNPGFVTGNGNTDVVYAANRVYYFPAFLLSSQTVDAFTFYCTSSPGGTVLARVGFVGADTNWQPSGSVTDCGTVSVSASGNKIGTFTEAVMPAGRVLCILETDATGCTIREWPGNPACGSLQGGLGAGGPYGNVYATGIASGAPALAGTAWTALTVVSGARPFFDMPMQWRLT